MLLKKMKNKKRFYLTPKSMFSSNITNNILGKRINLMQSNLHKKLNMNIKNMIGIKKFGGKNDWDGDGVPNKKDCQPRNTMRQDVLNLSKLNITPTFLKPTTKNTNYFGSLSATKKLISPTESVKRQKDIISGYTSDLEKYKISLPSYEKNIENLYSDLEKYQMGELEKYKYYEGYGWLKGFDEALKKKVLPTGEVIGVKQYSKFDETTGKITDFEAPVQSYRYDTYINYKNKTYKNIEDFKKDYPDLELKPVMKFKATPEGGEDWYVHGWTLKGSDAEKYNKNLISSTDNWNQQRADIPLQKDYLPVKLIPEKVVKKVYYKNKNTGAWVPLSTIQQVQAANSGEEWERYMKANFWERGTEKAETKVVDEVVPEGWEETRFTTSYAVKVPEYTILKKYLEDGKIVEKPYTVAPESYGETVTEQLEPGTVTKEAYDIIDPTLQKNIEQLQEKYAKEKVLEESKIKQKEAAESYIKGFTPTFRRPVNVKSNDFGKPKISTSLNKQISDNVRKIKYATNINKIEKPVGKIMRPQ